jgi:hypothetical protein
VSIEEAMAVVEIVFARHNRGTQLGMCAPSSMTPVISSGDPEIALQPPFTDCPLSLTFVERDKANCRLQGQEIINYWAILKFLGPRSKQLKVKVCHGGEYVDVEDDSFLVSLK